MISHPLDQNHGSPSVVWMMEMCPVSCLATSQSSPWCGQRNLFSPVGSCHAPSHTPGGFLSWSRENSVTLVCHIPTLTLAAWRFDAPGELLPPSRLRANAASSGWPSLSRNSSLHRENLISFITPSAPRTVTGSYQVLNKSFLND